MTNSKSRLSCCLTFNIVISVQRLERLYKQNSAFCRDITKTGQWHTHTKKKQTKGRLAPNNLHSLNWNRFCLFFKHRQSCSYAMKMDDRKWTSEDLNVALTRKKWNECSRYKAVMAKVCKLLATCKILFLLTVILSLKCESWRLDICICKDLK